jgi:hypothetical protein
MAKAVGVAGVESEPPTATHAQSVRHDTPATVVWTLPGFGVFGTIDHVVPFQVSAKVAGEGPDAAAVEPTALQVVWLKQSTPVRL